MNEAAERLIEGHYPSGVAYGPDMKSQLRPLLKAALDEERRLVIADIRRRLNLPHTPEHDLDSTYGCVSCVGPEWEEDLDEVAEGTSA